MTATPPNLAAPSVELAIGEWKHLVVFDYSRLEAIETATGRTVNDIVFGELASYSPAAEKQGSEEASIAALRKVRVGFVVKFVAGCLGVDPSKLDAAVPMCRLMEVFSVLVAPFCQAVIMLNGGAAADPPTASAASEPGLASNSA